MYIKKAKKDKKVQIVIMNHPLQKKEAEYSPFKTRLSFVSLSDVTDIAKYLHRPDHPRPSANLSTTNASPGCFWPDFNLLLNKENFDKDLQ